MATLLPLNYRVDSPDNLTANEVDQNFNLIAQKIGDLEDTLAAGGGGGGGGGSTGVDTYVELLDKATADLPGINTPLANSLAGKLSTSHAGAGGGAHALANSGIAGFMGAADKGKLDGISSGATANSPDASLLARSNHTGTQPSSTISDFVESSQDVIGAMIAASGGSYDDGAGTITLPSGDAGSIVVQDEGSPLATGATALNFVGPGVVASGTGATKVITISGGSGPTNTDSLPEGSTNKYFTEPRVRATVLTGLDTGTTGPASAADSVLAAIGKLQATKADSALSSGPITVQEEGAPLASAATVLNFVGPGVTASGAGATKTITITGGGGVTVQEEGVPLATLADTFNFVGTGVLASGTAGTKTINIPGVSSTDALPEGTTNKYFTEARVRATVLTGLNTTTTGAAAATDSLLAAIGKLQATKLDASAAPSPLTVQDEGVSLSNAAALLNFVGSGVTVTGAGSAKTVTIPGANGAVDVSAVAALTAAHCDRHLYSTSDAVTARSLPASGAVVGQYIEYSNHGLLPHTFSGWSAAVGMAAVCNPNETIQFVMSDGNWWSCTPVNPTVVPASGVQFTNYTTVLLDAGRRVPHGVGDETVRTFTINGALAYADGTVITFPNRTNASLQLALSGAGTLRLAGTSSTGTRTIPGHSYCTAMLDAGEWLVSGPGVT